MWQATFGRCIFKHEEIRVFDNYFYRWLLLGSPFYQTLICKFALKKPILKYIPKLCALIKNNTQEEILLLGLGGGAILHFINQQEITVIEKNKMIIELAKDLFYIKNPDIINLDAAKFMQNNTKLYKHLLIDIHGGFAFPPECSSREFFQDCYNALGNQGFFAINLALADLKIINIIREIFKGATIVCQVENCHNIIIYAAKSGSRADILERLNYKKLSYDVLWGCVAQNVANSSP